MQKMTDISNMLANARTVAAIVPADRLFGVFTRSFELPAGYVALAYGDGGARARFEAPASVAADDVRDVLFVRVTAWELSVRVDDLLTRDRHVCAAEVNLQVRALPEAAELDSLRRMLLGSRAIATLGDLVHLVRAPLEQALRSGCGAAEAGELVDSPAVLADAVAEALAGPCFQSGLEQIGPVQVRLESASYRRVREAEVAATLQLEEHAAQASLRGAIADAHEQRLGHLESMLTRLQGLADTTPQADLPELMQAFADTERAALYEALFESRARAALTRWIVVAAGHELLFFDAEGRHDAPDHRLALESEVGALRSVTEAVAPGGRQVLLVGASRGVHVVDVCDRVLVGTYAFDAEGLRGGVNAVALGTLPPGAVTLGDGVLQDGALGDGAGRAARPARPSRVADGWLLLATHSEYGIVGWSYAEGGDAFSIAAAHTVSASAVRAAQWDGGRFWCSVDDTVLSVGPDGLRAAAAQAGAVAATTPAGPDDAADRGHAGVAGEPAVPGRSALPGDLADQDDDAGPGGATGPGRVAVPGDLACSEDVRVFRPGGGVITALWVGDGRIVVGTADGHLLAGVLPSASDFQRLHTCPGRAVESIRVVSSGGVRRLVFTDTSLAVHARVVGDAFHCAYEAGGQTIKRVAAAADLLAGTSEARDRVIIWSAGMPRQPARILPVMRWTNRSVQDVALVARVAT